MSAFGSLEVGIQANQWHLLGQRLQAVCGAFDGRPLLAVGVYPDFANLICDRCLTLTGNPVRGRRPELVYAPRVKRHPGGDRDQAATDRELEAAG